MLVQVVKEERGTRVAARSRPTPRSQGATCVLMPNTARGRWHQPQRSPNAVVARKLKEIAQEIEVPDGAGLIVRTQAAQRTKAEIKRER